MGVRAELGGESIQGRRGREFTAGVGLEPQQDMERDDAKTQHHCHAGNRYQRFNESKPPAPRIALALRPGRGVSHHAGATKHERGAS